MSGLRFVIAVASICFAWPAFAKSLIVDPAVPGEIRQAATCYAFNAYAGDFLFGMQATSEDYAGAARFWDARFAALEQNQTKRRNLLRSARAKMNADFPRRRAPKQDQGRVEVYNVGYAMIIGMCNDARTQLTAANPSPEAATKDETAR